VASASIAQVHRARLKTPYSNPENNIENMYDVAIKIQHPQVKKLALGDIKLINFFTVLVENLFNDFRIAWLGNTFNKCVPQELDFTNELKNMKDLDDYFKNKKDE